MVSEAFAMASNPNAQQGNPYSGIIMLVIMFAIFYFLLIRPQQKRAKETRAMLQALQKGDEVVTIGGILGKVTKVGDDNVAVEIADNVIVQVQKPAIQNVLPKGTIKSI